MRTPYKKAHPLINHWMGVCFENGIYKATLTMNEVIEKTNFDGSKKERFSSVKSFIKFYPEFKGKEGIINDNILRSKSKSFDTEYFKLERFNVLS